MRAFSLQDCSSERASETARALRRWAVCGVSSYLSGYARESQTHMSCLSTRPDFERGFGAVLSSSRMEGVSKKSSRRTVDVLGHIETPQQHDRLLSSIAANGIDRLAILQSRAVHRLGSLPRMTSKRRSALGMNVSYATAPAEPLIRAAIDHPSHAALPQRRCAHQTRLDGDVKRAIS